VAQQTDETSSFFVQATGKVRDFLFADRISIRELRDYNLHHRMAIIDATVMIQVSKFATFFLF
jgi:hypothetical protein